MKHEGLEYTKLESVFDSYLISADELKMAIKQGQLGFLTQTDVKPEQIWICVDDLKRIAMPLRKKRSGWLSNVTAGFAASGLFEGMKYIIEQKEELEDLITTDPKPASNPAKTSSHDHELDCFGYVTRFNAALGKGQITTLARKYIVDFDASIATSSWNERLKKNALVSFEAGIDETGKRVATKVEILPPEAIEAIYGEG